MNLAAVFFLLLFVSFVSAFLVSRGDGSASTMRERLAIIRVPERLDAQDSSPLAPALAEHGWMERFDVVLERFRFARHLALLLRHSGRGSSKPGAVLLLMAAGAFAAALISHECGLATALVGAAAALAAGLPYLWLRLRRARRLKKFSRALPDAIELMARALRAGHSVSSAIEIVAEQSPQPLGAEFAVCSQQQKFGIPFRDALISMGERVPSKDLHFLITAVLVQKETGGDLTEILDRTTAVIRERIRIEGEIRTYTAQGRLTGWILSLLPVAMLMLINIITPGYSHILFYDSLGQKLLYAGATCIALGGLIIRKIVDIKV